MKELSKRILIKICSTRPYKWVVRKIFMRMMRRAAKAPEVQERLKALGAAAPEERFYAYFEAMTAVGNEMAKSNRVNFRGPTPETMQWMRSEFLLLPKLENAHATASEIEECRRLAEDPQCPPDRKQRIEAALKKATE